MPRRAAPSKNGTQATRPAPCFVAIVRSRETTMRLIARLWGVLSGRLRPVRAPVLALNPARTPLERRLLED